MAKKEPPLTYPKTLELSSGEKVRVSVQDFGHGFFCAATEDRARIFVKLKVWPGWIEVFP
jgi:hypothetical protein